MGACGSDRRCGALIVTGQICSACHVTRPLSALLAVTDRTTKSVRYVCRPTADATRPGKPCFSFVVRIDELDAIALADELPRSEPRREHAPSRGADLRAYQATGAVA